MKASPCIFLISFFLIGSVSSDEISKGNQYWIVENVVRNSLENLRGKISDMEIPNINETMDHPVLRGQILVEDFNLTGAEKYSVVNVQGTILPLRITNLTLLWKSTKLDFAYDFDAFLKTDILQNISRVYGQGKGSVQLEDVFLTFSVNLKLVNGFIQISPRGIYNFDVSVRGVKVHLDSLLNNEQIAKLVGVFISELMPNLVDDLKIPVFEIFLDQIVDIANKFLRGSSFDVGFSALPKQPSVLLTSDIYAN